MNEEKINQILEGINLLVLSENNINSMSRVEYNQKTAELLNPQQESIKDKTEDALGRDLE